MIDLGFQQASRRMGAVAAVMVIAAVLMGGAVPSASASPLGTAWMKLVPQGILDLTGTWGQRPGAAPVPMEAPLSREFLQYRRDRALPGAVRVAADAPPPGEIPDPVDMSHLRPRRETLLLPRATYPSSFDLRQTSPVPRVTPVRSQGSAGSCWAHATYASLESCLLPGEEWDFSENHLKNTRGFDREHREGGNHKMSAAYLARWSGPVAEEDDPYDPESGISPPNLLPRKHVQQIVWLANDASDLKWAIYNHGAAYCAYHNNTSLYFNRDHNAYYCDEDLSTTHAVGVVGWDDNYPAGNFNTPPPGDGAWIVKNSWGEGWGEDGYFYLSYHDASFTVRALFPNAEPTDNYGRVYQYDPLGQIAALGYGLGNPIWIANVFTAEQAEFLVAVGFYAMDSVGTYEGYVYRDVAANPTGGTLAGTFSGVFSHAGYITVPVPVPVGIGSGETFAVVLKLSTPNYTWPAAVELAREDYSSAATASPGQSYYSHNGETWTDLTTRESDNPRDDWSNANFCIKVFANAANPPSAPTEVRITPEEPLSGDDLTATASGSVPAGPGGVSYHYQWSSNPGAGWSQWGHDGATLASDNTSVGQQWKARARATDGAAYSAWTESAPVTVRGVEITGGPAGNPNPVQSGGEVACSVSAECSAGHALVYEWTANGGSFENHTSAASTWTAPGNTSGSTVEYTIFVTVTCAEDAGVSATASYIQQVEPEGAPAPGHEVTVTQAPSGGPNPVASGAEVACSVTAECSEGHGLSYEWTATGGSFGSHTSAAPTWTAPVNTTAAVQEYQITVTVTCAEDDRVTATASYTEQVEPVALADTDRIAISVGGDTYWIPCDVHVGSSATLQRAVVAIHGATGTSQGTLSAVLSAANIAGKTEETIVVAPYFNSSPPTEAGCLHWERPWQWAADGACDQTGPVPISSFDFVDQVLWKIAGEFAGIDEIVVLGHSAGGQYVNRYAATSPVPTEVTAASGIGIRYVLSAPSSYVYLTSERSDFSIPYGFSELPPLLRDLNVYPFGLDNLHTYRYVAGADPDQIRNRYFSRNITHLCGQYDNDPDHPQLSIRPESMAQGRHRLERAQVYWHHLLHHFGSSIHARQRQFIIPGVDHGQGGVFRSAHGLMAIFNHLVELPHQVMITAEASGSPDPVASRGEVRFSVMAADSHGHGHDLVYAWTAEGDAGEFDNPSSQTPTWTAPANNTQEVQEYQITVTVNCAEDAGVSATTFCVQRVGPESDPVPGHEVLITQAPSGDPNPVASGGEVACSVVAECTEGHGLTWEWTATGGSFENHTSAAPIWTAPANTTGATVEYTISVTVTCAEDAGVSATASHVQQVEPEADPVPEHEVSITEAPSGDPNPVASGGEVQCSVTAECSEGHGLNWEWSATGGGFENGTSATPTWTAPANNTEQVQDYQITVTVTCSEDEEISATDSYTQQVEPVHEIIITELPSGDPNPVESEGSVLCSVTAQDSLGHGLLYEWSATGGSFQNYGSAEPNWIAPANTTGEMQEYQITVTIACAEDEEITATASYTQRVEPAHVTITELPSGHPNPVASEGEVVCSVTAEDSLGHDLEFLWSADAGSFDDPTLATTNWTAPANNTQEVQEYQITVTITCAVDGDITATSSYTQQVEPVHEIIITDLPSGDPNPVASEGSVLCSVTAEDSLGHELNYLWSADAGSFENETTATPTWTAPVNNTQEMQEYQITVTISCAVDASVNATESYTHQVEPVHEITITEPPSGAPNPVASEGDVHCSVTAEDSLGHELSYLWSASAGSFDDPTAATATWTAPANNTEATQSYQITVTVTCSEDESHRRVASYMQRVGPGRAHVFQPGLQMVSVPLVPRNVDPAQMGFEDGRWARWDQNTGDYVSYDDDPDRHTWFDHADSVPGKGYWTFYPEETGVAILGVPLPDGVQRVRLPAGWSQIGNPRLTEVPWSIVGEGALMVRHNGAEMTLAEAQAAGVCEDFAWAYRHGSGYELVYDHSIIAVSDHDRLNPWEGYWFLAHQPVELAFPSMAEVASATPRPAAERAEGDWSIPFIASVDGASSAQVVVGQSATPRQMQLPPSFGADVQLSVLRDDLMRLGVDLQEQGEGAVWTLQAVSGLAGAQVTLQWPDLSDVPHEYRPMLVDVTTGKRTYMRTSQGYSFTAGEAGEVRRFEVQMAPAGVGAPVTTVTASATAGGNVELRVTLSASANVDAEVMNIAGRQVGTICRGREMEAGSETLLWDVMSDRGTRLPGGMYLIRVTARTENGQQTSGLAPLQLER